MAKTVNLSNYAKKLMAKRTRNIKGINTGKGHALAAPDASLFNFAHLAGAHPEARKRLISALEAQAQANGGGPG